MILGHLDRGQVLKQHSDLWLIWGQVSKRHSHPWTQLWPFLNCHCGLSWEDSPPDCWVLQLLFSLPILIRTQDLVPTRYSDPQIARQAFQLFEPY